MSNLGGFMDYAPRGLLEAAPLIGSGAASSGAVLARMFATPGSWFARHADMTGLLISLGVSGVLAAMPSTRSAAVMTALGGVAAALPRVLEALAAKAAVAGVGYYAAETANPLLAGPGVGMVRADQLNGAGVGYAVAARQPHAYGTVPGVAGVGSFAGPMQDVGGGAPIQLLQGGTNHTAMGLASRYGTTHMR